jgi:hypothetical protein
MWVTAIHYADSRRIVEDSTRSGIMIVEIFLHAAAHSRHICAHCRQAASLYFSHSVAQISQTSAHNALKRPACSSLRWINATVKRHISAQYIAISRHFASVLTFGESEQARAVCSHSLAHFRHARMHASVNSSFILVTIKNSTQSCPFWFVSGATVNSKIVPALVMRDDYIFL